MYFHEYWDALSKVISCGEAVNKILTNDLGLIVVKSIVVKVGGIEHDPLVIEWWIDQVYGRCAVDLDEIGSGDDGGSYVFELLEDGIVESGCAVIVGTVKKDVSGIWSDLVEGVIDIDSKSSCHVLLEEPYAGR